VVDGCLASPRKAGKHSILLAINKSKHIHCPPLFYPLDKKKQRSKHSILSLLASSITGTLVCFIYQRRNV
jgi:hypothetical protein